MKLKLILTTATVGVALALPSSSSAAPPAPTFQDSVSLTATPASTSHFSIGALDATSGPGGEIPADSSISSSSPARSSFTSRGR